jgi:Uma2 family endonuclease
MTPLPEHEVSKVLIGDLIKVLLEELDIDFWSLGSTTFKNQLIAKGIEPDDCFYIKNEAAVRGKDRLDLAIDPPPDLAIEVEITSCSNLNIYQALKVSELWRFEQGKLEIYILQESQYVQVSRSLIFANLPIIDLIPEYLSKAKKKGRNKAIKAFRSLIRDQIDEEKFGL